MNEIMKTFQDMNIKIASLKKPQIKLKLEMKTWKMANKNLRDKPHQQIIR